MFRLCLVYHCMKSVQILRKSTYSVRIQENTDQKKLRIWTLFTQCTENLSVTLPLSFRCNSPVGMQEGANVINLELNCRLKGTVMHEIGHSIGMFKGFICQVVRCVSYEPHE